MVALITSRRWRITAQVEFSPGNIQPHDLYINALDTRAAIERAEEQLQAWRWFHVTSVTEEK